MRYLVFMGIMAAIYYDYDPTTESSIGINGKDYAICNSFGDDSEAALTGLVDDIKQLEIGAGYTAEGNYRIDRAHYNGCFDSGGSTTEGDQYILNDYYQLCFNFDEDAYASIINLENRLYRGDLCGTSTTETSGEISGMNTYTKCKHFGEMVKGNVDLLKELIETNDASPTESIALVDIESYNSCYNFRAVVYASLLHIEGRIRNLCEN